MISSGTSLHAAQILNNDQARKALGQILNSPEFARANFAANLTVWLEDFFRRLLNHFNFNGRPAIGLAAWARGLDLLIVLIGLALIVYLARLAAPFWRLTQDVQEQQNKNTPVIPPSPAGLLAEADQKASGGDFRSALRDVYLSMLLEMDRRQMITCTNAKTDSEYLQELGQKASGLEEQFRALASLFEFKWYGLENCSEADFLTGRELYKTMLRNSAHG
jgi:hypothetical protein